MDPSYGGMCREVKEALGQDATRCQLGVLAGSGAKKKAGALAGLGF